MNAPETRLQQFSLKEKLAKLVNVNPRAEIHGDERVPACDLRVSVELPNSALEMFDAALPKALFMPDPTEHQTALRREEEKGYAKGLKDGMAIDKERAK